MSQITIVTAVGVSDKESSVAVRSLLFQNWIKKLQTDKWNVTRVEILEVDARGSEVGSIRVAVDFAGPSGVNERRRMTLLPPLVNILAIPETSEGEQVVLVQGLSLATGRQMLSNPAGVMREGETFQEAVSRVLAGIALPLNWSQSLRYDLSAGATCSQLVNEQQVAQEAFLYIVRAETSPEVVSDLARQRLKPGESGRAALVFARLDHEGIAELCNDHAVDLLTSLMLWQYLCSAVE